MPRPRPHFFSCKKLEKPYRGKHWYVEGYTGEKRIQKWFKSEQEAKRVVANRNSDIKSNATLVLPLDPKTCVQATAARDKLALYGKEIPDAVSHYCNYLDTLSSSIALSELCVRVRAEFERRLAAKEIGSGHNMLMRNSLKKFSARFGDRPIKLLADGQEIKTWLATLSLAVKTRNWHLGNARLMFNLAREWNLLDAVPFERVSGFRDPNANTRQVQILSPEQLTAFLNALPEDLTPLFALVAFSGLRWEEASRLDWSEVKLDRDLIELPGSKSKTHRRRLIEEIPENLKAWLAPFAAAEGPVRPRKDVKRSRQRAARAAGIIPWPQNALRHSFCSYAVAIKGTTWTAKRAGNSEIMLEKHYLEVVSKEDAVRYWAIYPPTKFEVVVAA